MKTVSLTEVLRKLVAEELNSRLIEKEIDLKANVIVPKDGKVNVLSKGLKVIHKKSGFLYTVDRVGGKSVILKAPEGKLFKVSKEELEKDYELG